MRRCTCDPTAPTAGSGLPALNEADKRHPPSATPTTSTTREPDDGPPVSTQHTSQSHGPGTDVLAVDFAARITAAVVANGGTVAEAVRYGREILSRAGVEHSDLGVSYAAAGPPPMRRTRRPWGTKATATAHGSRHPERSTPRPDGVGDGAASRARRHAPAPRWSPGIPGERDPRSVDRPAPCWVKHPVALMVITTLAS